MAVTIWFVTHSTSEANDAGLAAGLIDSPLSAVGRQQAAELRVRYAAVEGGPTVASVDAVVTSSLQRARDTAAIAFAGLPIIVTADARLVECDFGSWSGRPRAQVDGARLAHIEVPWPDGESYVDATLRHRAAFDDIARERPGATVLVVGHYATWMALEHLVNRRALAEVAVEERPWAPGWRYEYATAGEGTS